MRGVKKLWVSNTEDTEKANHRGHGEKQTTEGTENTEIGKEGADTLVRPYKARTLEVECGGVRAGWRGDSRAARDCVALPA